MPGHDEELEIALRRLRTLIRTSRSILDVTATLRAGTTIGEVRDRLSESLQELQDNINELENVLSSDPQTVEETQV